MNILPAAHFHIVTDISLLPVHIYGECFYSEGAWLEVLFCQLSVTWQSDVTSTQINRESGSEPKIWCNRQTSKCSTQN